MRLHTKTIVIYLSNTYQKVVVSQSSSANVDINESVLQGTGFASLMCNLNVVTSIRVRGYCQTKQCAAGCLVFHCIKVLEKSHNFISSVGIHLKSTHLPINASKVGFSTINSRTHRNVDKARLGNFRLSSTWASFLMINFRNLSTK